MKSIKLKNINYRGYYKEERIACRGIVTKGSDILLSYERKNDKYMIPGGGREKNETLKRCCKREVLEETGIVIKPVFCFLKIEKYFDIKKHTNFYFTCEIIQDTGKTNLTDVEKEYNQTFVWVPIKKAIAIFSDNEKYKDIDVGKYGLYKREMLAIKEYLQFISKKQN